jgi:hypothetical protein
VDEAVLDPGPAEIAGTEVTAMDTSPSPANGEVEHLLKRSRRLLDEMHAEDREAAIELHEKIEAAIDAGSASALQEASRVLEELLFFVEGQR